jgi:hypothetical protein
MKALGFASSPYDEFAFVGSSGLAANAEDRRRDPVGKRYASITDRCPVIRRVWTFVLAA